MKHFYALSNILKPTLWVLCGAVAFALLFVGSYIYVDYNGYLSSYQAVQKRELHDVQQKIRSKADALKKLSVLTRKRISSSKGNAQQIQLILNSSYSLLPESEFLKIQKIKYDKFSKPQATITRS